MSSKASVSSPTLLNPTTPTYGDHLLLDGTRQLTNWPYAKQISNCIIWVEDTPPIIASQILDDVSALGFNPV